MVGGSRGWSRYEVGRENAQARGCHHAMQYGLLDIGDASPVGHHRSQLVAEPGAGRESFETTAAGR